MAQSTKTTAQVKINMPTFVKRVRNTLNTNPKKISAEGTYKMGETVCIIGAGLSKQQLNKIIKSKKNGAQISELISSGFLQVDKRYANRLENLQEAFDNEDKETVRLRFRHLEASVKKNFPAAFAA